MSKSSDISICAPLLISIKGRSRMMAIRGKPEPCSGPLSTRCPPAQCKEPTRRLAQRRCSMHASPGDVEEGRVLMAWQLSAENFQRPHPYLPLGRERTSQGSLGEGT